MKLFFSRAATSATTLLLLTTPTTLLTRVTAAAQHIDERAVLQEIYQAVGGKAWSNNYGWAENLPDVCEWAGVLCDKQLINDLLEGRHVEDGSHQDNNNDNNNRKNRRGLEQTTDDEYEYDEDDADAAATDLATDSGADTSPSQPVPHNGQQQRLVLGLHLRGMDLSGRMPEALWTLPMLEFVDVSDNAGLVMDFAAIHQADRLQTLHARGTATDSVTGISNARDTLLRLDVSGAPLESPIPEEIYQLTGLTALHMQNCALTGSLSDGIAQLSHLRVLNLADNSLTEKLPATALGQLVHLRVIAVANNLFNGPLPPLADLVLLNELYANNNEFAGPIPAFDSQPALQILQLENNFLQGPLPANFLGGLVREQVGYVSVDLSNNRMESLVNSAADLNHLRLQPMHWNLVDNPMTATSLPNTLCNNVAWNDNIQAATVGCSGLLCPVGTYAPAGHASLRQPCLECPSVTTAGSTICLDQDDASILKTLYLATGGETTWKRNTGWLQDTDYCSWHGVTCSKRDDASDGRVVSLDLVHNGLIGTIPPTIFHLQFLRHLSVSRNDVVLPFDLVQDNQHIHSISISNTLTTNFKGLEDISHEQLHYLFADRLPIRGTLPSELLAVHTLRVLSLSECEIKGTINTELGAMGNLHELYLFDNQLQGNIPTHIGQLQKLRVLSLAKNRLTGSLPEELERMPVLEALSVADQISKGGGITGRLPAFAETATLTSLHLGDNVLQGEIPESLLASVNLDAPVQVTLTNNRLNGVVPGSLAKFERLTIDLPGNEITQVDHRLCNMDHWMGGLVGEYGCDAILCPNDTAGGRQVYADVACQVCPKGSGSSSSNAELEEAWMGRAVCGLDDQLSEHGVLKLLYKECGGVDWHIQDNWMSDEPICTWAGITCDEKQSVKAISLANNQLLGDFPTEIYTLPSLEKLTLYNNDINFNFENIETANKLKTLILDSTGLTSLRGIGNARSLEELSVRFNKLSGEMPQDISRLVNLKSLDVSNNDISGDIPYWISTLSRLETFRASSNKFSGPLYDFADMTQLSYIDLSKNKLQGRVPETMLERANRNDKVVVDVEDNELSGDLPMQLAKFPFLSLHASGNKISGIAVKLCSAGGWNDNDVEAYGCDGILCPAGYANAAGRQTSHGNPCFRCSKAKYMGSKACTDNPSSAPPSSLRSSGLAAVGVMTVLSLVATTIGLSIL